MRLASIQIRRVTAADASEWQRLRESLWPETDRELIQREMHRILQDSQQAVFVAQADGRLVGFVEASIHPHAIGCEQAPVGYVEGWFVEAAFRKSGLGRMLLQHAEKWAIEQGCTEMASDTQVENEISRAAHTASGYTEVQTLVHFRKVLGRPR